jgi:hypothetical protein
MVFTIPTCIILKGVFKSGKHLNVDNRNSLKCVLFTRQDLDVWYDQYSWCKINDWMKWMQAIHYFDMRLCLHIEQSNGVLF